MAIKVVLINRITHNIVNLKGKQMRPMFVFLVLRWLFDYGQEAIGKPTGIDI